MERIQSLINKLNEQAAQQATTDQMLGTVQMLNAELEAKLNGAAQILGTAKVAVLMPRFVTASRLPAEHEKFIPKPVPEKFVHEKPVLQKPTLDDKPPMYEEMEKLLLENGSVSKLQKNGQLDMVFDPMLEIPTFSHQIPRKEINDAGVKLPESLNDKLRQGKTELVEVLKESPVRD